MRLVPQTLAGQLTLFVLAAVLAAQMAVFMIFSSERAELVRSAYRENIANRVISLAELARDLPAAQQGQLLRAASSRNLRFSLDRKPITEANDPRIRIRFVARTIATALGLRENDIRVAVIGTGQDGVNAARLPPRHRHRWRRDGHHDDDALDDDGDKDYRQHRAPARIRHWLAIAVPVSAERWLNLVTEPPPAPPPFGRAFFASLTLTGIAVALVVFFAARRITRPIGALAASAERLGRGDSMTALSEAGPLEVRRMTGAFNEMRARIDRFLRDRTQMLAAISHDLRTPITALRLRAELVDDEETRTKLVQSVEELQAMTEAALAFARADATAEAPSRLDLDALVDSLVDDLAEMGKSVTRVSERPRPAPAEERAGRRIVLARQVGLKRALRNLIDNAVAYGGGAEIDVEDRIEGGAHHMAIKIIDHGPGIAEDRRDEMFKPFTRGEASRSRDTGGIGLGLAIARDIILGHGGDIALSMTPGGGLTVTVTLPAAPKNTASA